MNDSPNRPGKRLPFFTAKNFFSLKRHNAMVRVCNAVLNPKIVGGTGFDSKISDNNLVFTIPDPNLSSGGDSSTTIFHPFKIYNVPGQDWKTFQIRSGLAGFRPSFDTGGSFGGVELGEFANNNEVLFIADQGSDQVGGVPNSQQNDFAADYIVPPGVTYDVITITGSATFTNNRATTWVIDTDPANYDDEGYLYVGFWISFTDAADALTPGYIQINARIFGDHAGFAGVPWPSEPNIIPIGILAASDEINDQFPSTTEFLTLQYLFDHAINRYPINSTQWRGRWVTDGLSGQYFYPGDIVSHSYGSPAKVGLYAHVGANTESSDPPTGNWTIMIEARAP